jgi:hypothetical protein
VTDLDGRVLHEAVERRHVERRLVDLDETVLDPRFVVVTRRELACELDADAWGQLRVQVHIGGGVIEAVANLHQTIAI